MFEKRNDTWLLNVEADRGFFAPLYATTDVKRLGGWALKIKRGRLSLDTAP